MQEPLVSQAEQLPMVPLTCQAMTALPEENQREDALIRLNKAALELCQEPWPLQSDFLYQMW